MTAATAPTSAIDLGLEHPSAVALAEQLATIVEPSVRREQAARALADRRADLALYRALLVERYGAATPTLAAIIDADQLYADLAVLTVA